MIFRPRMKFQLSLTSGALFWKIWGILTSQAHLNRAIRNIKGRQASELRREASEMAVWRKYGCPQRKELKPHKNDIMNAKVDRMNRNTQIRKQKNAEVREAQKVGSLKGPPKIVGVLNLSFVSNASDCFDELVKSATWSKSYDQVGLTYAYYEQHKSRCAFMVGQNIDDVQEAVDIARVADLLVCVVNVSSALTNAVTLIDERGDRLVGALKAASCPETLVVPESTTFPEKHMAESRQRFRTRQRRLLEPP